MESHQNTRRLLLRFQTDSGKPSRAFSAACAGFPVGKVLEEEELRFTFVSPQTSFSWSFSASIAAVAKSAPVKPP